jgi:catechol 2,3-dioxygenase-like lactoylglutathione lyase family enzyme
MASDARGPAAVPLVGRPIHHVGLTVPDLRAAIETWATVYGAGPFFVNEHVAYDECTSSGAAAVWDHSAGFGQWGAVPVELQQTHDVRPVDLARTFTADGRSAVNHVGITAEDPLAESARLASHGFELRMHDRIGEIEFFWHDATEAFGCCIEIITAAAPLDSFFETVARGAIDWDGRNPIRGLGGRSGTRSSL